MKSSELIELLAAHPEYEVQIETERMICPIAKVDTDCFYEEEGFVFVITPDMSEEADV